MDQITEREQNKYIPLKKSHTVVEPFKTKFELPIFRH